MYLLIDGSYFIFYRYFALVRWWKHSHPEETTTTLFQENSVFIDKFKQMFIKSLTSLPSKLNIINPIIIVSKDCKRQNIWRKQLYPKYKEQRTRHDDIAFFMNLAYHELFPKLAKLILFHPSLEADDCIALFIKYFCHSYTDHIYIIASDKDYLQLTSRSNLHVYDLTLKDLTKQKTSFGCANKDRFCKIIMGDQSDNISSVFSKCGPKTALKCFEEEDYFQQRLQNENAVERYLLNQTLIDFNYIPQHLQDEFTVIHQKTMNNHNHDDGDDNFV